MRHPGRSLGAYLIPSFQQVLFIAVFLSVIGLGPRLLNIDGDLGRHLTIGNYILDHAVIPSRDIFSHTMYLERLTPHEWLAQVIFALAYHLMGLDGVVILSALLIGVTFTWVYLNCLARSGSVLISLAFVILAAATASLHWLARPHLFTWLLAVVWVAVLERIRAGEPNRWWTGIPVMLLWANLHGAFLVGFAILALYLAGELWDWWLSGDDWMEGKGSEQVDPGIEPLLSFKAGTGKHDKIENRLANYFLLGVSSLLVTLINPSGWRLWSTGIGFLRSDYLVSHTAEYLPPNFHEPSSWPFAAMITLSILVLGTARNRLAGAQLLSLAAWTAMGLYSVRNVPLYALLAAPILAETAGRFFQQTTLLERITNLECRLAAVQSYLRCHFWPVVTFLLVVAALGSGVKLDYQARGNRFLPEVFPVGAVDWLETHPVSGNMFNFFPWGGYMLFRLWPQQQVFIDGQTDFYGEALTREYEQVITLSPGWEDTLDDYQVGYAIMPSGSDLVMALRITKGWRELFRDETATILARTP